MRLRTDIRERSAWPAASAMSRFDVVTITASQLRTKNSVGGGHRKVFFLNMENYTMYRIPLAGLLLSCAMIAMAATAMVAQADTIKPVKESKPDIAGAIFLRKDAVKETYGGSATTDVVTFTSKDSAFQTGIFKSGPFHEETKGPQGYPDNEFMYFISGSVTLTSSDGSVMVVHAGEGVTLPRGWTGIFDTQGYTKMYVTYNPDDIKK